MHFITTREMCRNFPNLVKIAPRKQSVIGKIAAKNQFLASHEAQDTSLSILSFPSVRSHGTLAMIMVNLAKSWL